jgi:hypothetical protein
MATPKTAPRRGLHSKHPAAGRPSKYKPEYGLMLIEHCKAGGFIEGFCMDIDIHKETLLDWTVKFPEFSDSYKKARMAQEKHFLELGYGLATGQVKGQVAAWCFMMKNMFKWRDVQDIELNKVTTQKLIINMGDDG